MAWLSFLKSKDFDPAQFEKELASITKRIAQNERNVSKYGYQCKRLRRFFLVYGALGYIATLGYIAFSTGLDWRHVSRSQWVHILALPLIIMLLMKAVTALYDMRIERTQTSTEVLKDEHAAKIEELKEKTKFSSTQALLNRFADGNDLSAQLDEELMEKQKQLDEIKKLSLDQEQMGKSFGAYPQQNRGWLDTIVDTVVGSDELAPSNRYALICQQCFLHNGLAPPGQVPGDVKYRCPGCGFVNGVGVQATLPAPVQENTSSVVEEKTETPAAIMESESTKKQQ